MNRNNNSGNRAGRFARTAARSFGFLAAYQELTQATRATGAVVRGLWDGAFRLPAGPAEQFEDAVKRFRLSDEDIEERRRAFETAANLYLVVMFVGLAAVAWLTRRQPLLPVALWAAIVIALAGGQAYLCSLRARALRERRLPDLPRALAWSANRSRGGGRA